MNAREHDRRAARNDNARAARITPDAGTSLGPAASHFAIFPGGYTGEVTPVPIPNTEVKLSRADGTAGATLWESRTLPGF